jgi:hypothetical protein
VSGRPTAKTVARTSLSSCQFDDEPESGRPAPVPLKRRRLIGREQTSALMGLFKTLSNGARLRLPCPRTGGKRCVTKLAEEVGMTPQAVSYQRRRLVDRAILDELI